MTEFNSNTDRTTACLLLKVVKDLEPFEYSEVQCPSCDDTFDFVDLECIADDIYKCPNCSYVACLRK